MQDPKPTLISEILSGCAAIDDGRQPDDIMLTAVAKLGDLATQVRIASGGSPGIVPGEDGVAGAAMDVLLCLVDHLRSHELTVSEVDFVKAATTHKANHGHPFTTIALGWGAREKTPLRHRASNMLDCMTLIAELHGGPEEEYYRERDWRLAIGANAMVICLKLVAGERPGISDDELIGMARRRLDAWGASIAPSASEPEI